MSLPSETASGPTGADLLDCSRYGEVDDVESILSGGVDANHKDAHGNTALHLSCANGHADVVRALIKGGASHLPNGAGNRPLQWAIQNKHVECVKALLELYPESSQMNVLDKNGFGKSALTDAFKTGEADMVTMVLNHKSAEEDMLLSQSSLSKTKRQAKEKAAAAAAAAAGTGAAAAASSSADGSETTATTATTGGAEGEEEEEEDEGEEPSITHELGFAVDVAGGSDAHGDGSDSGGEDGEKEENGAPPKLSVLLRELPIRNPDECFGDDAREDTTGLNLWAAAIVLGRWMASPTAQAMLEGKTVLELGAGCGAGGISAAVHGRPASVLVTDLNVETMANLAHNVELNRHRYPAASEVRAVTLDWGDESTWDAAAPPVDVVLAADVVYQATQTSPLIHAILSLLKPGGTFLHVSPTSERDGLEGFLDNIGGASSGGEGGGGGCALSGFDLVSVSDAPPEYIQNPLISGSEEDCILHFTELPSATFRLHEFRKRA